MQQVWYLNPGWYALIFSICAILLSFLSLLLHRRSARATIDQSLVVQRNEINNAFMRHAVKGPFATILGVSDDELEIFIPKAGLLFLQVNLLSDVYQHRDILGDARISSYKAWATKILAPWIYDDAQLKLVLSLIYESNDIMGEEFVNWLKEIIPLRADPTGS